MSLLTQKKNRSYINVLSSDGTLRMVVPEGTEGAVKRDYETSDGKKGTKFELVYKKLEGTIKHIAIWTGDYGDSFHITVANGGDEAVLSLGVNTPFGEDFAKKLKNIDLDKSVSFEPYSFENEKGRTLKGISIKQDDVKIKSYYWDEDTSTAANNIPEPEGDTDSYSTDDWKIHFLKVRKFLIGEVREYIQGKFPDELDAKVEYPEEDIDPDKVPF